MQAPSRTPLAAAGAAYFRALHQALVANFQTLDGKAQFTLTPWQKQPGDQLQGGGVTALLRGGDVFEKMGINVSEVHGTFAEPFRAEIPGASASCGQFWAAGVSLVAHPANPHVPAIHFNIRRLETSIGWFGGGADLTPAIPYAEDTAHFHQQLEILCNSYQPGAYPRFKKWCADYFYLPHRQEERGVGGIFFDNLTENPEATFAFIQAFGNALFSIYQPLAEKRRRQPFSTAERHAQLLKRGRYAEFNLMYDRGTRFGLQSGGNAETILMSLPPEARW